MKPYFSPEFDIRLLFTGEELLASSGDTPEDIDDAEMDSDELFE